MMFLLYLHPNLYILLREAILPKNCELVSKLYCVQQTVIWQVTPELLQEHYAALCGKPFFCDLVKYMGSGPVVPMVRWSQWWLV